MKTQEEMNALKEEVVTLNEKLHELTEEELAQVSGGSSSDRYLLHQEVLMQTMAEKVVPDSDSVEQPEQPTGGYSSGVKVEPGYEYLQWLPD